MSREVIKILANADVYKLYDYSTEKFNALEFKIEKQIQIIKESKSTNESARILEESNKRIYKCSIRLVERLMKLAKIYSIISAKFILYEIQA